MAETYHVGQYRYIGDIDGKNPCTQLLNTYPTNSSENNGDTNKMANKERKEVLKNWQTKN